MGSLELVGGLGEDLDLDLEIVQWMNNFLWLLNLVVRLVSEVWPLK